MKRWTAIVVLVGEATLALSVVGLFAPCCKTCCRDSAGGQGIANRACCCLVLPAPPAQKAGSSFEVAPLPWVAALSRTALAIKVPGNEGRVSLLGVKFSGPSPPRLYVLNSTWLI